MQAINFPRLARVLRAIEDYDDPERATLAVERALTDAGVPPVLTGPGGEFTRAWPAERAEEEESDAD